MKITVRFQAEINPANYVDLFSFESALADLLNTSVFPTLNAEPVALSLEVKKARS